jgi:hypothetical protein
LAHLEKILESLIEKNRSNVTLIGDLNQDLLSANGDNLRSLMESFNFASHMNLPTRTSSRKISGVDHVSSTCIDVVYSNSNLISSKETLKCPFSDHNFAVFSIDAKCANFSPSAVETRALNLAKLDSIHEALKQAPFSSIDSVFDGSIDCINDKFFALKKLIIDVLDSVAPLKQVRIKIEISLGLMMSLENSLMKEIVYTRLLTIFLQAILSGIDSDKFEINVSI